MSDLDLHKLNVTIKDSMMLQSTPFPRCYTLTHSDRTGDLFLTIGPEFDQKQIAGWYTRLMRDEVLATWKQEGENWALHIHLHVSGGIVLGGAKWRDSILRKHLRGVLQVFRYGDPLFTEQPEFNSMPIYVHFHAKQSSFDKIEAWGKLEDYRVRNQ